jgi:hypothetical protein
MILAETDFCTCSAGARRDCIASIGGTVVEDPYCTMLLAETVLHVFCRG